MGNFESETTMLLWEKDDRKNITLKNMKTGRIFKFVVRNSFVVGRGLERCDLQVTLDDRYMSGRHLRFMNEGGIVSVEDLHTKNGTKVNGKSIFEKTIIHSGDVLKMGISEFEVTIG